MKMIVYYKYAVNQGFFKEEYDNLTEEEAKKIEDRYIKAFESGEYVDCQIEVCVI